MDAQTKIANLKAWFFQVLENENRPYFMLSKPQGNSTRQITNQDGGDLNGMWENLERTIWNEYNNGVRRFLISIRKGGMKGSEFQSELDLGFSTINNGASINGMGNNQQATQGIFGLNDFMQASIGLAEMRKEFDAYKTIMEKDREIERRDQEIAALQMDSRTQFEKVADGIGAIVERVNEMGGFEGIAKLVYALKANPQAATAAMQGIFGTPAQADNPKRRSVKEQEAPPGATVPAPEQHTAVTEEQDEEPAELSEDEEMALEAVEIMAAAGIENPGAKLLKVARFAANDPKQAETFLKMLPNE